jgi:hypothetical protein
VFVTFARSFVTISWHVIGGDVATRESSHDIAAGNLSPVAARSRFDTTLDPWPS